MLVNDGTRQVCAGVLYPDRTFVKLVRDKHILRLPKEAIAVQTAALDTLDTKPCDTVIAVLTEQGDRQLAASLQAFHAHGFLVDRGFGPQVALPLSLWRDLEQEQPQLSLFGGGGLL